MRALEACSGFRVFLCSFSGVGSLHLRLSEVCGFVSLGLDRRLGLQSFRISIYKVKADGLKCCEVRMAVA